LSVNRFQLIRHAASHDISTHSLLLSEYKTNHLLFSTLDILFIQQFGQYLFQLASTSTRVQALIRYMRETVTTIEAEFKTMNELTQRYVGIIAEDAEKVGSEVGLELFEFLVTGGPSPTLKEWLVETLTERVRRHLIRGK
jgi:anaphase-promoting complex subunit 4